MNTQNFKINGKYSICLDEFFDLENLRSIYPEIVKGLILSKDFYEPITIGNQHAILNKDHRAPTLFIRDEFSNTDEYRNLKDIGFTETQIYDYVRFMFPVKTLGTKLLLRTYPDYSKAFGDKHNGALNKDQPAYKFFPSLKTWIKNTGAFKEVGRILLFINEMGSYTPVHCDYSNLVSLKDQFLWINLFKKKSFFVLDEAWKKQYLDGEINIFDNATWHGSDPAKYSCFTIRIDGVFNEEFLKKVGLYEHFNKNI